MRALRRKRKEEKLSSSGTIAKPKKRQPKKYKTVDPAPMTVLTLLPVTETTVDEDEELLIVLPSPTPPPQPSEAPPQSLIDDTDDYNSMDMLNSSVEMDDEVELVLESPEKPKPVDVAETVVDEPEEEEDLVDTEFLDLLQEINDSLWAVSPTNQTTVAYETLKYLKMYVNSLEMVSNKAERYDRG